MKTLADLALEYAEALKEASFCASCFASSGLREDELALRAVNEKVADADHALRCKAAQEAR